MKRTLKRWQEIVNALGMTTDPTDDRLQHRILQECRNSEVVIDFNPEETKQIEEAERLL